MIIHDDDDNHQTREILNARRLNPPSPPPVDALQLCIEAAGKWVLKDTDDRWEILKGHLVVRIVKL